MKERPHIRYYNDLVADYLHARGVTWSHRFSNKRKVKNNLKLWYVSLNGKRASLKKIQVTVSTMAEDLPFVDHVECIGRFLGVPKQNTCHYYPPPSVVVFFNKNIRGKPPVIRYGIEDGMGRICNWTKSYGIRCSSKIKPSMMKKGEDAHKNVESLNTGLLCLRGVKDKKVDSFSTDYKVVTFKNKMLIERE